MLRKCYPTGHQTLALVLSLKNHIDTNYIMFCVSMVSSRNLRLSFLISPPLYFYLWRDIFFFLFFRGGGGWPHNDQLSSETLNCDYIGGCCMLKEGCSMYRPNDIPEYVMYRWQSVSTTQNMSRALTKEHKN